MSETGALLERRIGSISSEVERNTASSVPCDDAAGIEVGGRGGKAALGDHAERRAEHRAPAPRAVDERHGLFLGAVFNKFDREIRRKEKRQQLQTVDHGLAQNFQKQRDKPPEAEYQTVYHRTAEMFHRNCEFLFVFCGCFSPQNGV